MTTADAANYLHTTWMGQLCDDKFQGYAPWVQETPPATEGATAAADLHQNLLSTQERCEEIFEIWGELEGYYGGADVQAVLTTMNELFGQAMALGEVGQAVSMAHAAYATEVDTRGHTQVKSDNDSWAPGFAQRYSTMETDHASLSRDEFEEKYGQDYEDEYTDMVHEREPYGTMADHVFEDIMTARETYDDALRAIDLDELSELKFELRNEAVDVADDVEELTDWIMESEAFADLNLSREDARRIAEQVFQEGGWEGSYTDAEGRTWVRAADGRMVRAGSMMDPNLTQSILDAMVNDEEIGQIEIEVPSQDGQKILNTTISELYGNRSGAAQEWLKEHRPDLDATRTARGFLALGTLISLFQGAHGANSQRDVEMQLYPLLNTEELNERRDRNLAVAGVNVAAGTTVTVVSAAFAPATLGGSVVIGAIVNVVTGEIIGWLVESADEALTTATVEEIDEMSDEDFNS